MNPKGKFSEALKHFDNKEYKEAKKACDKILSKFPTDEEALALQGLSLYYLNEKEQGKKIINQALKINLKSPIAWHFYSILHKEEGNIPQALKCYLQAYKHDPTNYNVIRDLSYLQLYLRQLASFAEYSKKALDLKPHLPLTWVTYAFANSLIGEYELAIKLLDSVHKFNQGGLKKNEKHEMLIFKSMLLSKMNKHEEAINVLIENKNDIIDKTLFNETIIKHCMKTKNKELGIEYCLNAMNINPENINYYIWYFNFKLSDDSENFNTYDELLKLPETNANLPKLLSFVQNELLPKYPKSKVLSRLQLAFATGDTFKDLFTKYFLRNVQITLPSFFINVKFIYKFQSYKIPIIENILNSYLQSIETSNKVTDDLDTSANVAWVHFYSSEHYDYFGDLEKALTYINKAIDTTPTVVEFYMTKAKILKHGFMMKEATETYNKARTLDLGDRYLNAKYAKYYARMGDIAQSLDIMKNFVKDPLTEENVEYYQCMWYENECANGYLQNGKVLHAHYLFKAILMHFKAMFEDQSDFYNFCLRRYMVNDLYSTIIYLDKITKNKYVFASISKLDLICSMLKSINKDEYKNTYQEEYEELKKEGYVKYKYTSIENLIQEIENDLFTFLKPLQLISNDVKVHFYCVKYFLIKSKTILALKSLRYLSKTYPNSFYFIAALKLFKEYAAVKKSSFNEVFINEVNEILDNNANTDLTKWNEEDKVNNVLYKMYMSSHYKTENESFLTELLSLGDKVYYRKLSNEKVNEMIVWVSLFVKDDSKKEQFTSKLSNIMRLEVSEDDIKKNITFYETYVPPVQSIPK